MKALHIKSEESGAPSIELLFDIYDYGNTKGHDWRIYIKSQQYISLEGERYSAFNPEAPRKDLSAKIEVEHCLYSLTEKELDKLAKWVAGAKKELAKMKKKKGRGCL